MDSSGESSCKGREDGDGATGPERPLKKARFAWQVKGKHHLKTEVNHPNNSTTNDNQRPDNTETVNDQIPLKYGSSCDEIGNEFQCYVNSEEKRDLKPSEDQGTSSLLSNNNTTNEQYPYPRYKSRYDRMPNNDNNSTQSNSQYHYQDNSEDQCISQWQAKQMVTCCIDNTINRVLDRWVHLPLPTGPISVTNTRSLALNMAQFVNHLPGDNTVENEGILMAISAHGLQNANEDEDTDLNLCDTPESYSPILRLTPLPPEDDIIENEGPSGNNDNYYDDSDNDDQLQLINAAVLYAINSKGLTASSTDYG